MTARTAQRLSEFFVGLIFGWGLLIAGMTDPGKVLGFLDLAGAWDPSLAFVMGGAIVVGVFAFSAAKRRSVNVLGGPMLLSEARQIDRRLVVGSLVFGVGWGLAGFCPGPAVVSMAAGQVKAAIFVASMMAGMLIFSYAQRLAGRDTGARAV